MLFRPRPQRALRGLLAFCGALPLVQACGGRSDTEEYLYGDDPVTVGGSSSTSTGGSRASAGRPGAGGVAGVSGGANVAGSFGAVGGVGIGGISTAGGTTGEAGTESVGGMAVAGTGQGGVGVAGTTSVAGAAGMPSGPAITCGASVCNADTQTCCGGLGGLECLPKGASCQGAVLGCTTNSDCAADVCCFSITGEASSASSCRAQCNYMGGGRDRQLCQVDADCRPPFRYCTPTVFGLNMCTRRSQ